MEGFCCFYGLILVLPEFQNPIPSHLKTILYLFYY